MTPDELARLIPPEVAEAAAHAIFAHPSDPIDWEVARAALAAGLAAWPGMSQLAENDSASIRGVAVLILPFPEATNDKGDANV